MYNLPQKLAAEFIGTFTLIFIGAGSICADQFLSSSGQGGVGLLGIAAAHGLAIAIMVTAMGHISGGHFNPAITIGFWVTRRLGTLHSLFYWIAQLLGATAAAYLLKAIVPDTTWGSKALGAITPDLAGDFTRTHGMALEAVMTFFLVFVVFATAVDARGAFNKIAGFAIGLTITMDILFGGPLTGGAMNPARAFGPALAVHHWQNHGVYWVGPLVGGVIAGFLYDRLFLRNQPPA
ncbi:MAG TPA: MIP/aquaporin family protein [Candidatus Acidoferrales bacterium]|nr:MIP/aquaporin family protein [Candidatus Acidoferrales bacterium]